MAETANQALLEEIRERFRYASDMFREPQKQRNIDMRYVAGDPWEEKDRAAREDNDRPCVNHDELNQYLNACVNNARQNKRGIKASPAGNGASDKTAELREDLIRTIEYRSQAQGPYLTGFQAMVEGSYGFMRITRRYLPRSFNQEILIKTIPNPDSVLYDPDCKEADWSDGEYCFVLDPMSREEFKRRWPKAKVKDFGPEEMRIARDFIGEKQIIVCEYWRIEKTEAPLYELPDGTTTYDKDKAPAGARSRPDEKRTVCQYFSNGVELLEENPQPGELLAIIPFIGMQRWIDRGSGPKREISSLGRLARDPQMSLAYLNSQEMEEAGMSPKVSWVGYVGQFETDAEAWETANKIPHSVLQADPTVDAVTGQVLPLPTRVPFTPNFQAYEVAKDSCRRAIQAAMGISPLPTAAQRQNEKSGVALEKITDAQNLGSYHFVDSYERALAFAGRVIDSWIPVVYDAEDREVGLHKRDDSRQMVRLNTAEPYPDPKTGEPQQYTTDTGDHDLTISAAPSYASQVEEAAEFLDTLIQNLKDLPLAPPQAQKLLALAIRMRELGPKGDQMADIISPDENDGTQQAQQAMAQVQQLGQVVQVLQQELQKLQLERAGKVIDNQAKMAIAKLQIEAGIAEAEINTKAQQALERNQFVADAWKELHGAAHEAGMQADQQAHEQSLADQQAQQQQALQSQQLQAQQQQQQQQGENQE
jgi:hypothetical protein